MSISHSSDRANAGNFKRLSEWLASDPATENGGGVHRGERLIE
jgi:hypothetical protein